ncbi:MAG: sortase [Candidatus Saccharimonadales bacterium]
MNPDDNSQRHVSIPKSDTSVSTQKPDRDLAVALMRQQIERLYREPDAAEGETASSNTRNVYDQTHDNSAATYVNPGNWETYHTAWQQYYQTYYERYYLSQLQQTKAKQAITSSKKDKESSQRLMHKQQAIIKNKALAEIKAELNERIHNHAHQVRHSRHFIPIISALVVMSIFLFLQYNRLIYAQFLSFVSPGSINPQNVIVDPADTTKVGPEPRIIIPKINVDAPTVFNLTSLDEPLVQESLKSGVVHYPIPGASANPGEKGNTVFLGHSSNDVFDEGGYKFIFVQLEQMKTGDIFYLNYNSVRYTYSVTSTETILPSEVNKLVTNNDKPTATLVTCTPIGTAQKRFLVHAEQITPDPDKAVVKSDNQAKVQPPTISGNSKTFFDRLFGF